jgi:uncharacterized protein (TIGR02996 family)
MNDLEQHEAFLRAIFDSPDDDTARLVYADYLDEHDTGRGEPERARFIRLMIESGRLSNEDPRQTALTAEISALIAARGAAHYGHRFDGRSRRGFEYPDARVKVYTSYLPIDDLRAAIVCQQPHWNGAREVEVLAPPVLSAELVGPLLGLSAFARATVWNFGRTGRHEVVGQEGTEYVTELFWYPVLTDAGVRALAGAPAAARLTELELRGNGLTDDAALALVDSPHLGALTKLGLIRGNEIGPAALDRVRARFGAAVE